MGAIQLGIANSVGSLASIPKRDLLLQDFDVVHTVSFPSYVLNHFLSLKKCWAEQNLFVISSDVSVCSYIPLIVTVIVFVEFVFELHEPHIYK